MNVIFNRSAKNTCNENVAGIFAMQKHCKNERFGNRFYICDS